VQERTSRKEREIQKRETQQESGEVAGKIGEATVYGEERETLVVYERNHAVQSSGDGANAGEEKSRGSTQRKRKNGENSHAEKNAENVEKRRRSEKRRAVRKRKRRKRESVIQRERTKVWQCRVAEREKRKKEIRETIRYSSERERRTAYRK